MRSINARYHVVGGKDEERGWVMMVLLNACVCMLEPVRRSNVFGLTPPPSPGILTVFPSSSVCGAFWLAGQGPKFRARTICRAAEQEVLRRFFLVSASWGSSAVTVSSHLTPPVRAATQKTEGCPPCIYFISNLSPQATLDRHPACSSTRVALIGRL